MDKFFNCNALGPELERSVFYLVVSSIKSICLQPLLMYKNKAHLKLKL